MIHSVQEHQKGMAVTDLQFSLDRTYFITASKDKTAKVLCTWQFANVDLRCLQPRYPQDLRIRHTPQHRCTNSCKRLCTSLSFTNSGYPWWWSGSPRCHHYTSPSGEIRSTVLS